MKTIISTMLVITLCASCNKTSLKGGGRTISETRTVASFTGVQVQGSSNVNITQGPQTKVEVIGYENLVSIYETYVQNGTLVLKFKDEYFNIRNNNINVSVTISNVDRLSINGSGDASIKNCTGTYLYADINGSGRISAETSTYDKVLYKVNGSGNISASQLTAKDAEVEIHGSGNIDVYCTLNLKASISGSGDINYWGNPTAVNTEISGSGRIRKK